MVIISDPLHIEVFDRMLDLTMDQDQIVNSMDNLAQT